VVGLLGAEDGGAVVLVALRIAAGDRQRKRSGRGDRIRGRRREPVEEVKEVLGILPRSIQANDEVGGRVALGDVLQALA
jgi:hypothetical protein